jgi:hypothetical protein
MEPEIGTIWIVQPGSIEWTGVQFNHGFVHPPHIPQENANIFVPTNSDTLPVQPDGRCAQKDNDYIPNENKERYIPAAD